MPREGADDGLVLVTAASPGHFRSLLQFLRSVRRYARDSRCVVFGMGLREREEEMLRRRHPEAEYQGFDFRGYPPHLDIGVNNGAYAWKPVMLWEVLRRAKSPVCWMDAGNVLIGPLTGLEEAVRGHGFYSPSSPGRLDQWTHPGMFRFLGLPETWGMGVENLNGACVAFDPSNPRAKDLAEDWMRGALVEECIAPPGASRENHRFDQALLTILATRAGLADGPPREYLGFKPHQDVETYPVRAALRSLKRLLLYARFRIGETYAKDGR